MAKYLGKIITRVPTEPTTSTAKGIWSINDVAHYELTDSWPVIPEFIVSATAEASNTTTTITVDKPSRTNSGDLMVAVMCGGTGAINWTGDTGWTELVDQNSSPNLRIAWKIAASGDGSSFTFTETGGVNKGVVLCIFRNASIGVTGAFGTVSSNGGITTAPQITATQRGLLLACFGIQSGSTFTTPSGFTIAGSINTSVNPAIYVFQKSIGPGATGTVDSDPAGTGNTVGILLSIQ